LRKENGERELDIRLSPLGLKVRASNLNPLVVFYYKQDKKSRDCTNISRSLFSSCL